MQLIDCGISGSTCATECATWKQLALTSPWNEVVKVLCGDAYPRPIQVKAIRDARILKSRRNLLISAPTNAGKSLVGSMILLDAIRGGGRAVLLEPLRALAREKAEELQAGQKALGRSLGLDVSIALTTGDYRLSDEHISDPPPDVGQIIVATPERLDAILRRPDASMWIDSVGAVVVDEAHLLSSPHRGAILEYLLTSFLCFSRPPRLVLLSATMGHLEKAQAWLSPCDVVSVQERSPPLQRFVGVLDESDDVEEAIASIVEQVLLDSETAVLVFVYQTASTEHLAKALRARLADRAGSCGPLAYHSKMNAAQREAVRHAFLAGESRCVISTTALGLGVNLPATHVIIRDVTFPGEGKRPISEILQMAGRAGRGMRAGQAIVLLRPNDPWKASDLITQLKEEPLSELVSCFQGQADRHHNGTSDRQLQSAAGLVASLLARHEESGESVQNLREFLSRSLGGAWLASHVDSALNWLMDPCRLLAFKNEMGNHQLTTLGLAATRATLPLEIASGVGQLIRDVLQVNSEDLWLSQWTPLDHLIALECLSDRSPSLRRFSRDMAEQVDSWVETPQNCKPLLYRKWIRGEQGCSMADQLLGSLGMILTGDAARQRAYAATMRAIVLYERGCGVTANDLERRWSINNLAGVEEQWRDQHLWLLASLSKILDTRCFYYCLREHCDAGFDRLRRVTKILQTMRSQLFGLQEHLKFCSPLGGVLRSIRQTQKSRIGHQTIRKIEAAGITNVASLASLSISELVSLGVRRDLARAIFSYLRRRSR